MARGWESKSVEQQQAEALSSSKARVALSPEQKAMERNKEAVRLARSRVLQQLTTVQNPHHRQMLEKALVDLNEQLARLG